MVIIFAALSTSNAHADSAFGIEYGGELPSGSIDIDDGFFTVSSPPKPHSMFEIYSVKYTAVTGVCYITAISETFENDKYGIKATAAYDKLAEALDGKYGPNGDAWETLKADALWDDADEFAMSLVQGDREHARWFKPTTDSQKEFDYVQIAIKALDRSDTYITLRYENSSLKEECDELLSAGDNGSL